MAAYRQSHAYRSQVSACELLIVVIAWCRSLSVIIILWMLCAPNVGVSSFSRFMSVWGGGIYIFWSFLQCRLVSFLVCSIAVHSLIMSSCTEIVCGHFRMCSCVSSLRLHLGHRVEPYSNLNSLNTSNVGSVLCRNFILNDISLVLDASRMFSESRPYVAVVIVLYTLMSSIFWWRPTIWRVHCFFIFSKCMILIWRPG